MENFIANNPSMKRLLVALLGAGAIALNKRFGFALGDTEVEAVAAIVLGYLAQSSYKEAAIAKANAAGNAAANAVTTPEAAAKVLGGA